MTPQRTAYLSVGVVLAVVAGGSIVWATSTAPEGTDAAQTVDVQPTQAPAIEPVRLPADTVVAGAALAIAKNQRFPTQAVSQVSQLKVCGTSIAGWLRSDSARITTQNAGVTIFVGAWRAGAASTAFGSLKEAASQCNAVTQAPGRDDLVATSDTPDGQRTVAAVRNGDVLSVAVVSSLRADTAAIAGKIAAAAPVVLKPRLQGICADPGSQSDPQATTRDPYTADYTGLRVNALTPVPDFAALDDGVVASVTETTADPTWQPPQPRRYPDLAPLLPSASAGLSPFTAPRGPAPLLIDPATILPPMEPQPTTFAGEEPARPTAGPDKSRALVPTVDLTGPGCGWAFTNTAVPTVTAQAITTGSQEAIVQALVDTTAEQGEAMSKALTWPSRYLTWVSARRVENNWELYRQTVEQANYDLATAKRTYKESVQRWNSGPTSEPTPTATPEPTPSLSISPPAVVTP